jgi:hypothetical protein
MIGKPENNHPNAEVSRSDVGGTDLTRLEDDFLVVGGAAGCFGSNQ